MGAKKQKTKQKTIKVGAKKKTKTKKQSKWVQKNRTETKNNQSGCNGPQAPPCRKCPTL